MNTNKHPTAHNIRMIADKLESMIPLTTDGYVQMHEGGTYKKAHECGTIACHGGFYELENALSNERILLSDNGGTKFNHVSFLRKRFDEDRSLMIEWENGADRLSHDLGFDNKEELVKWAQCNPALWGNADGLLMFASGDAFDSENMDVKLKDIVAHWRRIAERIEDLPGQ